MVILLALQLIVGYALLPPAYGIAIDVRVIEADGDPRTVEILAVTDDGRLSVGRPECAGPWFRATDENGDDEPESIGSWSVGRLGDRDYLLIRPGFYLDRRVIVKSLTPPTCGH